MKRIEKQFFFGHAGIFTLLFHFAGIFSFSQSTVSDSLLTVLKNQKEDSGKVKTLNALSWESLNHSDYVKSKEYSESALTLSKKLKYKRGMIKAFNNMGITFKRLGNYPEALNCYFSSLKIAEKMNDKKNIGSCYNNIGIVYGEEGNFEEALKNHYASLKIKKEIGDKHGTATAYNNIGLIYYEEIIKPDIFSGRHDSLLALALQNQSISLQMMKELKNKKGVAMCYNNIGNLYLLQGRNSIQPAFKDTFLKRALANHLASLKIKEENNNKQGIISSYINIGNVYSEMEKFSKAKENLLEAVKLSKETGEKDEIKDSYNSLVTVDTATKNYKSALENYKLFVLYRDSLQNDANTKKIVQSQMQYDFDKKELQVKAEQEKKDLKNEEEKRKQKLILWFTISGLLIVALLAIITLRSLVINKKKNRIISLQKQMVERQKHMVEEKQKEILDSIHYAKRIQTALITSEIYIERNLKHLRKK